MGSAELIMFLVIVGILLIGIPNALIRILDITNHSAKIFSYVCDAIGIVALIGAGLIEWA